MPEGLQFESSTGSRRPTLTNNNKTVTFAAVREMRPGEQLPRIRISASGKVAGDQTLKVKVTSRLTEEAVEVEETTTVYQ